MKTCYYFMCAAAVLSLASPALAQRDAGSKIRGDAYQSNSAATYQSHANDHGRILRDYSATGQPVPKVVVKEHADAIRSNVTAAKKAYAGLSDQAKKDAAKSLAIIEKAHASVFETCNMLDECCATGEGKSTVVAKCCSTVADDLKAAQAEHDKLMKLLKIETPKPLAKTAR